MKKFVFCLLFIITGGLVGCMMPASPANQGKPVIVATNFPLYDFARQIAGGQMDVLLLLPPGVESHAYEPTPQDIIRLQNCSLFLYIGGESDAWAERILSGMGRQEPKAMALMPYIDALQEEIAQGMQADAYAAQSADNGPDYDQHIWTSPRNAIHITAAITQTLCAIDPANADAYLANADAYAAQLTSLDEDFRAIAKAAKLHTLVFGDRFPFLYFAKEYGLSYYAAFPGCAEEAEPSAATVAFLIDKVRAEGIPAVLHIEFSNQTLADVICEATGAKKLLLHSCHNVSKEDMQSGATYLTLMRRNADTVKEALLCP